jgi:glutathione synthase/RimK-type ligase-like ATP-grasp enzyme
MASSGNLIVIVGSLKDDHVRAVQSGIQAIGHDPVIFDAMKFPEELPISISQKSDSISIDGKEMGRPSAVYVRSLYQDPSGYGVDVEEEMKENWRRTMMAFRESSTLLSSILLRWDQLGVPMFNPPKAQMNITKPYQIALLQEAGLPVPETLWSNDPVAVKAFCKDQERIYKPVSGGAATQIVSPEDLTDERLESLAGAPVTFQEILPGDDVRVFIIEGDITCSLRIESDEIDFRQNEKKIEPIDLPDKVKEQCIKAMSVVGLRFTGMDIKADRHGEYKILELNPSAMFLGFEKLGGVEICRPFCEAIARHTS